jgi:hypothetical protein
MDIDKFFRNYAQKVDKVVNEQLKKTGEDILMKSKELAPVATGEMIKETEVAVNDNRVEVRYNTDYSLYVHEDLEKFHPNGKTKFLETATFDSSKNHFREMAKEIGDIK